MPEVTILECDKPRCENRGEEWFIERNGRRFRVLRCELHAKALVEMIGQGELVPIKTAPRSVRGLNRDRLESLIIRD